MGQELFVLCYVTCVGFVCAGVLASFYQLIAARPARFSVSLESWPQIVVSVGLCTFAGPVILMRNALRGRRIEHRPIGWLFGSSAIAGVWSACSGILLINLMLGAMAAMH